VKFQLGDQYAHICNDNVINIVAQIEPRNQLKWNKKFGIGKNKKSNQKNSTKLTKVVIK
jgi:hypothetical protein